MEQKVEVEEEQEVEIKVEENPSVDSNTKDNATSAPEVVVSEEKPEDKEEELDDYSKRVQKRIKTLTEKYRNEEREREEATRFAATVKAENDDLKKRLANLDTGYLNEYGTRLESQLSSAKQLFKEARDAGDSEKEFEAQQALAKITVEQERYRLAKQRQEQNKVEVQKAPQQQPQQSQPQPQPDEKAKFGLKKMNGLVKMKS